MKILHLSGAYVWGGNENQLVHLIKSMNGDVENIIFCFKGSPIEKYAIENDIAYRSVLKKKTFSLKLAKELNKIVKKDAIDVIHIHTSNSVGTYMFTDFIFNLKTPTVFSKKGVSDKSSFFSSIKYNYRGIDKIICVSKLVETSFKKVLKNKNKHKTVVIHDGVVVDDINEQEKNSSINLKKQFNIDNEKFIVGNIGNHSEAKDLKTFVRTADYLINELNRKDVHFIQLGKESVYTSEYKKLIELYKLENDVTFAGYMEGVKYLIPQFDIFLMTSKNEGGPVSMLESFLMKVPVVITEVGIVPEAIINGKNGFYSDVGNYKALAENLLLLLNDEKLRDVIASEAHDTLFQKFTMSVNANKTHDLYKKMLDEKY